MTKHKREDYKIYAVKYYLNNDDEMDKSDVKPILKNV